MDLNSAMMISASGMKAQSARIRVISENIANVNSTGTAPGDDPYRRKVVTFKNYMDRNADANLVKLSSVSKDMSDFKITHQPHHPMADENGYVKTPNVNALIEVSDMREAQRSYEANVSVIENSRMMLMRTIDLLRD
jgi:flagellar basal-body rod protein FlgC